MEIKIINWNGTTVLSVNISSNLRIKITQQNSSFNNDIPIILIIILRNLFSEDLH
jgi:hypothetical protein